MAAHVSLCLVFSGPVCSENDKVANVTQIVGSVSCGVKETLDLKSLFNWIVHQLNCRRLCLGRRVLLFFFFPQYFSL